MLYFKDINNHFITTGDKVIAVMNNKLYKGTVLGVCRIKACVRLEVNVADRIIKSEKYLFPYINHRNIIKDVYVSEVNQQ